MSLKTVPYSVQQPEYAWNERMQAIVSLIPASLDDVESQRTALHELAYDFVAAVRGVCETIVDEISLAAEDKSIKPAAVGGVAGGLKYIHEGILLKFAADDAGIYGGSKEGAGKAAKLEFRAMQTLLELAVAGLRVPLQAVIQVQGYRIVASALLPISKTSLVYGSDDGGKTVHNESVEFERIASQVAAALYLERHPVGGVRLWLAADVEGHLGTDGRLYMLDTARLLPAEGPPQILYGAVIPCTPSTAIPTRAPTPPPTLTATLPASVSGPPAGTTLPASISGPPAGTPSKTACQVDKSVADILQLHEQSMPVPPDHMTNLSSRSNPCTGQIPVEPDWIPVELMFVGLKRSALAALRGFTPGLDAVDDYRQAPIDAVQPASSGAGAPATDSRGISGARGADEVQGAAASASASADENERAYLGNDHRNDAAARVGGTALTVARSLGYSSLPIDADDGVSDVVPATVSTLYEAINSFDHADNNSSSFKSRAGHGIEVTAAVTPIPGLPAGYEEFNASEAGTLDTQQSSSSPDVSRDAKISVHGASQATVPRYSSASATMCSLANVSIKRMPWPRACTIAHWSESAAEQMGLPWNGEAERALLGLKVRGPVLVFSRMHRGEHLTRMLRRELLQRFKTPVSADAHSGFGREAATTYNATAKQATQFLHEIVIPEFASQFDNVFLGDNPAVSPVLSNPGLAVAGNESDADAAAGTPLRQGARSESLSDSGVSSMPVDEPAGVLKRSEDIFMGSDEVILTSRQTHIEVTSMMETSQREFEAMKVLHKTASNEAANLRLLPLSSQHLHSVAQKPFSSRGQAALDLKGRLHEAGISLRSMGQVRNKMKSRLGREVILASAVDRSLRRVVDAAIDEQRAFLAVQGKEDPMSFKKSPQENHEHSHVAMPVIQTVLDTLRRQIDATIDAGQTQRDHNSDGLANGSGVSVGGVLLDRFRTSPSVMLRVLLLSKFADILSSSELRSGSCPWRDCLSETGREWVLRSLTRRLGARCTLDMKLVLSDESRATTLTASAAFKGRIVVQRVHPTAYPMELKQTSLRTIRAAQRIGEDIPDRMLVLGDGLQSKAVPEDPTLSRVSGLKLLAVAMSPEVRANEHLNMAKRLAACSTPEYVSACLQEYLIAGEIMAQSHGKFSSQCGRVSIAGADTMMKFREYGIASAMLQHAVLAMETTTSSMYTAALGAAARQKDLQGKDEALLSALGLSSHSSVKHPTEWMELSGANFKSRTNNGKFQRHALLFHTKAYVLGEPRVTKLDSPAQLSRELLNQIPPRYAVATEIDVYWAQLLLGECLGWCGHPGQGQKCAFAGKQGFDRICEGAVTPEVLLVHNISRASCAVAMESGVQAYQAATSLTGALATANIPLNHSKLLTATCRSMRAIASVFYDNKSPIQQYSGASISLCLSIVDPDSITSMSLMTSCLLAVATDPSLLEASAAVDPGGGLSQERSNCKSWVINRSYYVAEQVKKWAGRQGPGGKTQFDAVPHILSGDIAANLVIMGVAMGAGGGNRNGYISASRLLRSLSLRLFDMLDLEWPWEAAAGTEEQFALAAGSCQGLLTSSESNEYCHSLEATPSATQMSEDVLVKLRGNDPRIALTLLVDATLALGQPGLAAVIARLAGHTIMGSCRGAGTVDRILQASLPMHSSSIKGGSTPSSAHARVYLDCISETAKQSLVVGTESALPALRVALLLLYTGSPGFAGAVFEVVAGSTDHMARDGQVRGEVLFAREYCARSRGYEEVLEAWSEVGVMPWELIRCLEAASTSNESGVDVDAETAVNVCLESGQPVIVGALAEERRGRQLQAVAAVARQCGLQLRLDRTVALRLHSGIGAAWNNLPAIAISSAQELQRMVRRKAAIEESRAALAITLHGAAAPLADGAVNLDLDTDEVDDLLDSVLSDVGIIGPRVTTSEITAAGNEGTVGIQSDVDLGQELDGLKLVPFAALGLSPSVSGNFCSGLETKIVDMRDAHKDGWGHGSSAVMKACEWVLPAHVNPVQMTAQVKYAEGGPDPIDYVNVYPVPTQRTASGDEIPPHWLFVTQGLSNTYDDNRQFRCRGDYLLAGLPQGIGGSRRSGFGFELVLRIVRHVGKSSNTPVWPVVALQTLARYLHASRTVFSPGHFVPDLLDEDECKPTGLAFRRDPQFPAGLLTKNGVVEMIQAVGLLKEELEMGQLWSVEGVVGQMVAAKSPGFVCGPLALTDPERFMSVYDVDGAALEHAQTELALHGGSVGTLGGHIEWTAAGDAVELDGMLFLEEVLIDCPTETFTILTRLLGSRLCQGQALSVNNSGVSRSSGHSGHVVVFVPESLAGETTHMGDDLTLVSEHQPLLGLSNGHLLAWVSRRAAASITQAAGTLGLSNESSLPALLDMRSAAPFQFRVRKDTNPRSGQAQETRSREERATASQ